MTNFHRSEHDDGFSLVELLVVIVVLGVVSTLSVFAVRGASADARHVALESDQRVLHGAEEAYRTLNGRYASEAELVDEGFVLESELHDIALDDDGTYRLVRVDEPATPDSTDPSADSSPDGTQPPNSVALEGTAACPGTYDGFVGEYYVNQHLTGTPEMCRNDPAVDFKWGLDGPGGGIRKWVFSARFTRQVDFAGGEHTFEVGSDDGTRLFVDGELVIDWWTDHAYSTRTATVTLDPGSHLIVLEYYQYYGGAAVDLSWT